MYMFPRVRALRKINSFANNQRSRVAAALNYRRRVVRFMRHQMRSGRSRIKRLELKNTSRCTCTDRRPRGTSSRSTRWYGATAARDDVIQRQWRKPPKSAETETEAHHLVRLRCRRSVCRRPSEQSR